MARRPNRSKVANDLKEMVSWSARRIERAPPPFHLVIADWMQGAEPFATKRTKVLLGFRYSAKTWMLRQYIKMRWLRNRLMQVILHSSSDKLARDFVEAIWNDLDTDPVMSHLRPEPATSKYEFNLPGVTHEQGHSIVAAGIRTSMTGRRADLYAFEDPESDIDPEGSRDRVIQAFGEADSILHSPYRHAHLLPGIEMPETASGELPVLPRIERIQIVVLGQPHYDETAYLPTEDDLYESGEGHPLRDADFMVVDALKRDGTWLWPEKMNEKYYDHDLGRPKTVEEVKRSMTTSRWELQFRINVEFAKRAGPVLKVGSIRKVEIMLDDPIMFIDPADSASECEWGLCVMDLYRGQLHVAYLGGLHGEAYEGDVDDPENPIGESVWSEIFDRCDEFGVRMIVLEKNLKAARTACRRFMRKASRHIAVDEVAASRRKQSRIPETLEQPVNNGIVTADPSVLADRENLRQMRKLSWRRLPTPNDRIDALALGVAYLIEHPGLEDVQEYDPFEAILQGNTMPRNIRSSETFDRTGIETGSLERIT